MRYVLLAAALLPAGAMAQTAAPLRQGALAMAHVRPLRDIGDDVIRVSSTPALSAPGWVITVHRGPDGYGVGQVDFVRRGRNGWRTNGATTFGMARDAYDRLAAAVDAQLARGDPEARSGADRELIICTDGPGWETERRTGGRETRLAGFCAEQHPNAAIVALVERAATDGLGWREIGPER